MYKVPYITNDSRIDENFAYLSSLLSSILQDTIAIHAGSVNIDFGAFPGKAESSITIGQQTNITTASRIHAWLSPKNTIDHSEDEHRVENIKVIVGNIIPGSCFTIYAETPILRLYGLWNISWAWI